MHSSYAFVSPTLLYKASRAPPSVLRITPTKTPIYSNPHVSVRPNPIMANTDMQQSSTATVPTTRLRVAYQGEAGSFSEQASLQFFNSEQVSLQAQSTSSVEPTPDLHFHPCANFSAMFDALHAGLVDRAVVPIENCLAGTIHENLDHLLRNPRFTIVGELDFHVRHCLMALPGTKLADISAVRSHPMALAQCDAFLRSEFLKSEVAYDTAGSAKLIRKEMLHGVAAIAGERAASIYNLQIIARDIQNESKNFTRFLILSPNPYPYIPSSRLSYKSSIAFCLIDSPGILCRALSVFAVTGIDLTKIESRHMYVVQKNLGFPEDHDFSDEKRWRYVFYVDMARHASEPAVAAALSHLQQVTTFYRLLGAYPAHTAPELSLPDYRHEQSKHETT